MKRVKRSTKTILSLLLSVLMILTLAPSMVWAAGGGADDGGAVFGAKAAGTQKEGSLTAEYVAKNVFETNPNVGVIDIEGSDYDTPPHSKNIDEENGVYNIGLSVTGTATTEVHASGSANVLLIYDRSYSMQYGLSSTSTWDDPSRADQAESVVYSFLTNLLPYAQDGKINIALQSFGVSATTEVSWTNNVSTVRQYFDSNGTDGRTRYTASTTPPTTYNNNHSGYGQMGTNWERALDNANTLLSSANTPKSDQTFVIFITDGAPTADKSTTGNTGESPQADFDTVIKPFYSVACDEALAIQNRANTTMFGIYAYGIESDLLDDLMYYSNTGSERPASEGGVTADTVATDHYFNAANTSALVSAISDIFKQIVDALGVTNVEVSDGTTSNVETTSGELSHLLEVNKNSYQYWLSTDLGPTTESPNLSNNQFAWLRVNEDGTGGLVTHTVTTNADGSITISWQEGEGSSATTQSETYAKDDAYIYNAANGRRILVLNWKNANKLYNYDPPVATLDENGTVHWELAKEVYGTLLNGVTYEVTFECYPSQDTLDTIARLKNGDLVYATDIPDEIKPYLDANGNLKTNTTAALSYEDTRDDPSARDPISYNDVAPQQSTSLEMVAVTKHWSNMLDKTEVPDSLDVNVILDGNKDDVFNTMTLQGDAWTDNAYISVGILTVDDDGTVWIKTEGHDFSFDEPDETGYKWELDAPILRPMKVNGVNTMLKEIEKSKAPQSLQDDERADAAYKENGTIKYFKLTIDGEEYYEVDQSAQQGTLTLSATNHRRSFLDITKTVPGGAPDTAKFPMTISVTNSNAEGEPGPTDPGYADSDAVVWFSVKDRNNQLVYDADLVTGDSSSGLVRATDTLVESADLTDIVYDSTSDSYTYKYKGTEYTVPAADEGAGGKYYTGYWYFASGKSVTVQMKDGYNLRILNLPSGSTYTINEASSDAYTLDSVLLQQGSKPEGAGPDASIVYDNGKQINNNSTNTIEKPDLAYKVTYTNSIEHFYVYHSSDNTIEAIPMEGDDRVTVSADDPDKKQFNIVNETKNDYLYGGYYSSYAGTQMTNDEIKKANYTYGSSGDYIYDKETPHPENGFWATDAKDGKVAYDGTNVTWSNAIKVPGDTMEPKAGEVYFLKEVPKQYLSPKLYYLYDKYNYAMHKLYMLTVADDENYSYVGFDITVGEETNSYQDSTLYKVLKLVNAKRIEKDGNVFYEYDEQTTPLTVSQAFAIKDQETNYSDTNDYIASILLWDGYENCVAGFKNATVDLPYWITLDGIKVTSYDQRNIKTGNGTFTTGLSERKTVENGSTATPTASTEVIRKMKVAESFTFGKDIIEESDEVQTSTVAMLRLYNPNSGEHFYTASVEEKDNLIAEGWNYEEIAWYAPETSDTPVYRLYNPNVGDHFYTIDAAEKDALIAEGWNDEGIGWYSDDAQSVPLYRVYNPNAYLEGGSGAHHYTVSMEEKTGLVELGWQDENIAWYGMEVSN